MSTEQRHVPVSGRSMESRRPVKVITAKTREQMQLAAETRLSKQAQTPGQMRERVVSWIGETRQSKRDKLAEDQRRLDGIIKVESVS